jgi:hypothetical protein
MQRLMGAAPMAEINLVFASCFLKYHFLIEDE